MWQLVVAIYRCVADPHLLDILAAFGLALPKAIPNVSLRVADYPVLFLPPFVSTSRKEGPIIC